MIYAICVVLALIADQALKYWITVNVPLNEGSVPLIPELVSLVNHHNTGAAFGIFRDLNLRWVFAALAIIFTLVLVVAITRGIIKEPLGRWSSVLVIAGALGNAIDRVMSGYVVDMFRLDFFTEFAIFNIADIFISVGGVLFCIYILFGEDFKGEPSPKAKTKKARKGKDGVGAVATATAAPAAPVSDFVDDDPFGLRESKNEAASAPVVTEDTIAFVTERPSTVAESEPEVAVQAFEPKFSEPMSEPVSEPAPEKKSSGGFSLEDIMAEFSDD